MSAAGVAVRPGELPGGMTATAWHPGTGDRLLHNRAKPNSMWTTTNIAELMPGVPTPLGWSVFAPSAELAMRRAFRALGALNAGEVQFPSDEEELVISIFYGHPSMNVDFLCEAGDRMPGGSGMAIAQQFFSSMPEGFESKPMRRYYPRAAVRLPMAMIGGEARARAARADAERFWRTTLDLVPTATPKESLDIFRAARGHYEHAVSRHVLTLFALVQPIFEQVSKLAADAPDVAAALQSGYGGHEESELLTDLWACAKGHQSIDEFLAKHGYQGPRGGELSAVVWREDREPLNAILEHYRSMSDDQDPALREQRNSEERVAAEQQLVQSLPAHKRGGARFVLKLAGRYMPLRSIGKVSYLKCFDVARASARRIGQQLEEAGVIEQREDVFYLTAEELLGGVPADARALVQERRQHEEEYRAVSLPTQWLGAPEPLHIQETADLTRIEGQGVSAGVVVGRVRVVTEPGETEMEPGEILVGHVTDPSWTSIMYVSAALVADIGGQLSHTAVVARELGLPCVVDTQIATKALRTGDLCRLDGSAGTIEILERAG